MNRDTTISKFPLAYYRSEYNSILLNPYSQCDFLNKIIDLMPIESKYDLLDVGCGLGNLSWRLANSVRSVLGVDVSTYAISFAKRNYESSNLKFELMDLSEIHKIKHKFDMIVCKDIVEHLTEEDRIILIKKCFALLNNEGYLIIISPINDQKIIFKILSRVIRLFNKDFIIDSTHASNITPTIIKCDSEENGFRFVRFEPLTKNFILRTFIKKGFGEHLPSSAVYFELQKGIL